MRRREMDPKDRRASPGEVVGNVLKQVPGTTLLVLLFLLLTVGDFLFNFSRAFVCLLPDLCEPFV